MNKYIFLVSRLAAFFIDYIPFWIVYYVSSRYSTAGYFISLLFLFLYRYILTSIYGATLGMMILKLKLVKYSFKLCLKREIYRFINAFYFAGAVYALYDPHGRTIYDIVSDTGIKYKESKDTEQKKHGILNAIASLLLVLTVLKWGSSFVLNDIGLIGMKRIYRSSRYYQSFDGDTLASLSQSELYKKTMGRKYTTVIELNNKPCLIRISNKLTFTEIYKLNLNKNDITGQYLYKIDLPLQFICSGKFINSKDLCGVSPDNRIVVINSEGSIYGSNKLAIANVISLKCGDIDSDGNDESVVLNRSGQIEIFKCEGKNFVRVYSGKVGEDIVTQAFYINDGIHVLAESADKSILYFYSFKDKKFVFNNKKTLNINEIYNMIKMDDITLVSNISRNNMMLKNGKIQRFEGYTENKGMKRVYNFGSRPARIYKYNVRNLEDVYDIDSDGKKEIIIKAVDKDDVQGQWYTVEIYKTNRTWLIVNKVLSKVENIFY